MIMAVVCTSCHRDQDAPEPNAARHERTMWPPLPAKGFVTGRKSVQEDVASGDAAFFLGTSTPLSIEIPQYAYHIDGKNAKRTPGIIIQAERTPDGKELAAMLPIGGGGHLVGLLSEFKLLGKVQPKED
jgi:hypothetical protein